MRKFWMRDLQVILSSDTHKAAMSFGMNWLKGKEDLDITVSGTKYLSGMKDSFTVRIKNLTYSELLRIIDGKFYSVEIKAGYRLNSKTSGAMTIFKGSLIYASYQPGDVKTYTVILLCGNELVAKYGQSRLNFTLNSGINMYAALKYICERAGIANSNVSTALKNRIVRTAISSKSSAGNVLEQISTANGYLISSDVSDSNNVVSILDILNGKPKVIDMSNNDFVLVEGYPSLSAEGLTMSMLPTYNLSPGNIIKIDNSLIDVSVSSANSSSYSKAMYFDKNAEYFITQLDYSLNNRNGTFMMTLTGRARSLYANAASLLAKKG